MLVSGKQKKSSSVLSRAKIQRFRALLVDTHKQMNASVADNNCKLPTDINGLFSFDTTCTSNALYLAVT